jgi:hypothetical protein
MVREIRTKPFRLRPQARDWIVDTAVGKHGVYHNAAARIESVRIGKFDQPWRRLGAIPVGEPRPAVEQKRPFVMVPGLADLSLHARRRRSVRGKEFTQPAAGRIDEFFQAERGDLIRHAAPGRSIVDGDPASAASNRCICGFERPGSRPAQSSRKPAERMRVAALERCAQRHGLLAPAARFVAWRVMKRARWGAALETRLKAHVCEATETAALNPRAGSAVASLPPESSGMQRFFRHAGYLTREVESALIGRLRSRADSRRFFLL